jgi:hypothetical protein
MIASGLAILRYRALAAGLGWAALVIGIAIFTPAGFIGFLLSGIWVLVASIVLFMAGRPQPQAPPAAA